VRAAGSDPLNVPLESLGATGYDKTLCSDRWNTSPDYDWQQFDQRYPGRPFEKLSLYPPARRSPENHGTRQREREVHEDRWSSDKPRSNCPDSSYRPRGRDRYCEWTSQTRARLSLLSPVTPVSLFHLHEFIFDGTREPFTITLPHHPIKAPMQLKAPMRSQMLERK
jgi:hypothetical protein